MNGKGFIGRLESLRGLAALSVAACHSLLWLSFLHEDAIWAKPVHEISGIQATIARALLAVFNGAAAVDVFFVLSGYVLARSLSAAGSPLSVWLPFIMRRFFRILPAFWLSLALTFVYLKYVYPGYAMHSHAAAWFGWWYKERLSSATLWSNMFFRQTDLNPNAWTLRVEMVMAMVFPILAVVIGSGRWLRSAVVLCIAFGISWMARHTDLKALYFGYMFVAGVVVERHGDRFFKALSRHCTLAILACSAAAIVGVFMVYSLDHHPIPDVVTTVAASLLIGALASSERVVSPRSCSTLAETSQGRAVSEPATVALDAVLRWFDAPWARFVGRISYSFYLLHFVVLYETARLTLQYVSDSLLESVPLLVQLAVAIISIGIAVPVSWAVYSLVEIPCNKVGKVFSSKAAAGFQRLAGLLPGNVLGRPAVSRDGGRLGTLRLTDDATVPG